MDSSLPRRILPSVPCRLDPAQFNSSSSSINNVRDDDRGGLDGFGGVPGFDSPSLESLTLNPFPNDGNLHASDSSSFTTATSKSASFVAAPSLDRDSAKGPAGEMATPTTQGLTGTCGLSPIPIRGAAGVAAFDPFALGGGGDSSPLQVWADRAKQTLAKVTASESNDEGDDINKGDGDAKGGGAGVRSNLFSKDLIGRDFDAAPNAPIVEADDRKPPVPAPPAPVSPPPKTNKAQPSLYSTVHKGGGDGDDEVPSLEWSFTSHQSFASSGAASSGAASRRAGQFLSHVVGRCYGCSEVDDDDNANADASHQEQRQQRQQQQHQAYFIQQLHDVKAKSASVVDEAARVVMSLLGDTVPAMVVAMTSTAAASPRRRHADDDDDDVNDPFRTARRHRRFPSASTFDYSESQNPTTTGEVSHYTTSDGEGTSFDDEYYDDDEDDDDDVEYDDDEDEDDDATQSSARGGSAAGGGSFDATLREGADTSAAELGDDGSDAYSPPVKNAQTNRPPRARSERIRTGAHSRRKTVESISPSFPTVPTTSSSSWVKDPLMRVNEGVHKLFGEAAVALSHHAPKQPRPHPKVGEEPGSNRRRRRRRNRDEMERAKDRFAC
jgi:cytochrome c553